MTSRVDRASSWFVLAMVLTTSAVALSCEAQVDSCSARMADGRVLRADESQRRLFVLSTEQELLNDAARARVIRNLESLVRSCWPEWRQDWNASFFSNAQAAGYKDEGALAQRVGDGSWERAYVAELQLAEKTLLLFPALSERRQALALK